MIEVIPAILETEFPEIERKIHLVEGLVDWVQIDIADNTLVPNTTFLDPEPFTHFTVLTSPLPSPNRRGDIGVRSSLRRPLNLELHMMVTDPLRYLENFHRAGFKRFFAHAEGDFLEEFISKGRSLGVEVGLAIDGPTALEKIFPFLDRIDVILVMAIEAGESGRPYREDTADKIKKIREADLEIPIAVDGAMNAENAAKVVASGATRINSNSFIFNSPDVKMAIEKLKQIKLLSN